MQIRTIDPHDETIALQVDTLSIINEFKKKGIDRRSAFIQIVSSNDRKYKDIKVAVMLMGYWNLRIFDAEVNKRMLKILAKI